MIERLIETEICYGMEINVKKAKVMRISRRPAPIQTMIGQKQQEKVEYINCLGIMIANDARCTREIKLKIAVAKAAFKKKKALFRRKVPGKVDCNLKKKLVSAILYGACT
jgi:hypothetical protein